MTGAAAGPGPTEAETKFLKVDDFRDDHAPGSVVGHDQRLGRDRESKIGVDSGSARLGWLEVPGWDRQTLSHGPFDATPGLITGWLVLNAHNTSMTHADRPIGRRARLRRFFRGLPQLHWREPDIDDNLAVGWYPHPTSRNPTAQGWPLIMHAGDTVNGILETTISGDRRRLLTGVQNLPILYAQIRRPNDVIHCVATTLDTNWAPTVPWFRPVAIDPNPPDGPIHASVHQQIQGEVNYRIDTRVDSFIAIHDPQWAQPTAASLWSWQEGDSTPIAEIDGPSSILAVHADGPACLTINGERIDVPTADGFGQVTLDNHCSGSSTIDLTSVPGLKSAEVIKPTLHLPQIVPSGIWYPPSSKPTSVSLPSSSGLLREQEGWERSIGSGEVDCLGDGTCVVKAGLEHPNPGRTIHTIAWPHPEGIDVTLRQRPPGYRGQGHRGRSGLCIMQDPDNLLIVNNWLDDTFDGSSISCFAKLSGREVMYEHDAVWSNVGHSVRHGIEHDLRVVVDGRHFAVWVDGVPVMYRRFADMLPSQTSLASNRIGVVSNWEWGDDTGTTFIRLNAGELLR